MRRSRGRSSISCRRIARSRCCSGRRSSTNPQRPSTRSSQRLNPSSSRRCCWRAGLILRVPIGRPPVSASTNLLRARGLEGEAASPYALILALTLALDRDPAALDYFELRRTGRSQRQRVRMVGELRAARRQVGSRVEAHREHVGDRASKCAVAILGRAFSERAS